MLRDLREVFVPSPHVFGPAILLMLAFSLAMWAHSAWYQRSCEALACRRGEPLLVAGECVCLERAK